MIIVFEDALVGQLAPITLGRPAYAISCGSYCLADWLGEFHSPVHGFTRDALRETQRHDYPQLALPLDEKPKSLLLINARLVPSAAHRSRLMEWWKGRQTDTSTEEKRGDGSGLIAVDGQIAAALVTGDRTAGLTRALNREPASTIQSVLGSLLADVPPADISLDLFQWPHDVVRYHLETMADNMNDRLARDHYHEIADGVFTRSDAKIASYVAWDTHAGPILLESNVQVGPGAYLQGPIHAQVGAKVNEHAAIKEAVSLGHTTKVGGEVEASIIEPYSNKQHFGYLGHSYIGSWVNLGAGTCNSDLKNTYGRINVNYGAGKIDTEMQFLGCFIGDYTRTAIQTSIFTGKTIGACSTLYGTVTDNVPSFVNYARQLGQETEVSLEAMATTQRRMFARRGRSVRPCDLQLLREMFQQTQAQRGSLSQEPLSL